MYRTREKKSCLLRTNLTRNKLYSCTKRTLRVYLHILLNFKRYTFWFFKNLFFLLNKKYGELNF